MKLLAKLVALLVLLLALLAVAAVILLQRLDPNDYKDQIRTLVQERTGYDLHIEGNIRWSLFPWLGVELENTRLAAPGANEQPLASASLLELSVQLLPLLQREIRMRDMRAEGLELTLQQSPELTGVRPEAAGAATLPVTHGGIHIPALPAGLNIDSLTLRNTRIRYLDTDNTLLFSLDNLQLHTGNLQERQETPLKVSGFFASPGQANNGSFELSATLWLDSASGYYRLDGLHLDGTLHSEALEGKTAWFDARGSLLLDLQRQQLDWQQLRLSFNQLKAMGDLQLTQLNAEPTLDGQLSVAALSLREFLPGLGINLPAMHNPDALSHLELNARLHGTARHITLELASLHLDDSTLQGELQLITGSQPPLHINLNADQLNLDAYLPPAESDSSGPRTTVSFGEALPPMPSRNPWSDQPLPLHNLDNLNLDLELNAEQLTWRQLPLEQVRLHLQAHDGLLEARNLSAQLLGGSLAFSARLDTASEPPALQLTSNIQQLPIDTLMTTLGEELPLSGTLDLNSQLTTTGNSARQWISQLDGTTNYTLQGGRLPDRNLEQQICTGVALLDHSLTKFRPTRNSTPLEHVSGSARLSQGVAHSDTLQLAIPGLKAKGKGTLDLNLLALDYRLGVVLAGDTWAASNPTCTPNARFSGLEWPLHCRGSLASIGQSCRLDQDALSGLLAP